MSDIAVAFTGLGHAYESGRWVFRHCAASIERGSVLALLGSNGRGKTTLLKLLLGVMRPSEGKIMVQGRAAFVPQLFQVSFDYSVLDMVLMGRAGRIGFLAQPSRKDEAAALAALDRFGLTDLARRSFHDLSGGQRQMVIFARALVSEPDILILDEPTSALDLKNQFLILDQIAQLSRHDGLTVLFTTHHPHHALEIADDALLMLGAQKFVFGPVADVLTEENLHALYGVALRRVAFRHGAETIETIAPVFRAVTAFPENQMSPKPFNHLKGLSI
jgi:iron complex transport system ATP-binding protein